MGLSGYVRQWDFDNGVCVVEMEHNYDLHAFEVYLQDEYLGDIYPDSITDMLECIAALDAGDDPIFCGWEDGCGNSCTADGWGYQSDAA